VRGSDGGFVDWTAKLLGRDHRAEGVGFEPTMSVTTQSDFQDLSVNSSDLRRS
jgi:hypothetical protein